MLRISSLPFTENFLEIDSTNLILPIVLSTNTDIALRLKSAHKAYEQGLLKAESLSALYQSVDFSSDQLNNWKQILKSLNTKNEVGMALLFQSARVQLLPITRLESLKEFWLITKILLVISLTFYHFFLFRCLSKFSVNENEHTPRFFRIINEVPTVLLVAIIFIVVLKPI